MAQQCACPGVLGIAVSMNGVSTWDSNAPMESSFGRLKSEWVYHHTYATREEACVDLFYYIETFYNRRQLHSAIGYLDPESYGQPHDQGVTFDQPAVHQIGGTSTSG